MAIATLVVFGGLGVIIIPYVRDTSVVAFIFGTEKYWLQILAGIVIGVVTAKAGWQIVELPTVCSRSKEYAKYELMQTAYSGGFS